MTYSFIATPSMLHLVLCYRPTSKSDWTILQDKTVSSKRMVVTHQCDRFVKIAGAHAARVEARLTPPRGEYAILDIGTDLLPQSTLDRKTRYPSFWRNVSKSFFPEWRQILKSGKRYWKKVSTDQLSLIHS